MRICYLVFCVIGTLFFSCSGTKHLPKGETLYVRTAAISVKKVKYDQPWQIKHWDQKMTLVYWNLWDLPNGSVGFPQLRGVPVRLFVYNWFYTEKENGFAYWMRNNFGEAPVTINHIQPNLKVQKVVNIFENHGHFGTTGTFHIRYKRNNSKGIVSYHFLVPKAYTYNSVAYILDSTQAAISQTFHSYQHESLLKTGDEFDLDKIKAEKVALWKHLQNRGHYFVRQSHIEMAADTTVGKKEMALRIMLNTKQPASYWHKQTIRERTLSIDSTAQLGDSSRFYRWSSGKMKKKILDSLIGIQPGKYYSLSATRRSMNYLSELGIFTNPLISFHVPAEDSLQLTSNVSMAVADATTIRLNAKGDYRSTGYVGPSLGLRLTQMNVFHGAENLSIDLDGFYNIPTGAYQKGNSNASGVSLRTTLTAPLLNSPLKIIKRDYALPKRVISLNIEFNDRKDFFTLATWSGSYGVSWKSKPNVTHRMSFVEITYSNIVNSTLRFDTLQQQNPLLRTSLVDQFILGSSYTYRYNNSSTEYKRLGTYFEGKAELAGNALYLLSLGSKKNTNGQREVFGISFSQYAQLSYDFRAYLRLTQKTQLAFRHVGGITVPYGNSSNVPYIKQFFIGGTNSLRPITARAVGPGRYLEFDRQEVNQVGDLKLEWNLEYRFPIATKISGAIWSDMGNIWLLQEDPKRPNSSVRWNSIFSDSYWTAGVGLRWNVNFLILRLDYGGSIYVPVLPGEYKWIWKNRLPFYPVIGFGLPF